MKQLLQQESNCSIYVYNIYAYTFSAAITTDGPEQRTKSTRSRSAHRIVSSSSSEEKKLTVTVKSIDREMISSGLVVTTKAKVCFALLISCLKLHGFYVIS